MSIDESSTPTLQELIDERIELRLGQSESPQPAEIVSYDEDSQTAVVQPTVMRVRIDEDGKVIRKRRPQIGDVPVCFFGGGTSGRITYPVKPGDEVLLIFCGVHLDRWHISGGVVDPGFVDPEKDIGRVSDCIAISGLSSLAKQPTTAPTDALVIHGDDIRAGGPGADDPVARKSDTDAITAKLNDLISTYGAHTHLDPVSGATGTPSVLESPLDPPDCSPVLRST